MKDLVNDLVNDLEYMGKALALAKKGKGFTSPNPCVGAVVVKKDCIVGQGWHRAAGLAHAEVEAIDDAGHDARGATLYVTLEPCNHFGRTPPCTHKIIHAGITRVVVGCTDPNPHVSGGGILFLEGKSIQVDSGIREKEAQTLIEDFIWYTKNNQTPFVILKCAATLDGQIATSTGDSQWITNEASRARVHEIRHEVDAILIGSGTLHADDPSLTCRRENQPAKDPMRIILDTRLGIRENARVITQKSHAPTLVVTGPGVSQQKKQALEKKGVQVLEVPLRKERLDLGQLMIKLGKMSIMSLLIEGGGTVSASAIEEGIVNKVLFFLAPKFLGGNDGTPLFKGKGPEKIKDAFELKQVGVETLGNDLLVTGYLKQ